MLSLPTKERKAMFNKPSSYSIPLPSQIESRNTDLKKEYKLLKTKSKQSVNFSKMPLSLAPSKKYTMIEEFKDELNGFKNILNEIKKTKIIQRTRNKESKK